ncbi:hypothetical protein [Candidatus Pristimantibacillus sp. PTI5]|uniref:hypothetical protein n=1 Tax=Candidatus Pristimantibacillus sp. PTI5 TaxID=3400422 RepID=UPI003B02E4AA
MGLLQGCSDGFWKNHPEDWPPTGFSTTDSFNTVFGRNAFSPTFTLLDALELMGDDFNSLVRNATGALLNAAHPSVRYPLTVDEVISQFQRAFDNPALREPIKDEFELFNTSMPCPLD